MTDPKLITILAQGGGIPGDSLYWEDVARHWRTGGNSFSDPSLFVMAAGVLTAILCILWMVRRFQQRHLRSKPMLTFHSIASNLGLSLRDQWLLVRLARQQSLPNPLTLLVSPATFEYHAQAFIEPLSQGRRHRLHQRLRALHTRLFVD